MFVESFQPKPIATWNNVNGVWETDQINLLCGHWAQWREVWPNWGMTANGQVFALPMPAQVTQDSEFLLLPTPISRDWKDSQAEHKRNGEVQTDTVARVIFNSGEYVDGNWGRYQQAVDRWEKVTGSVAPPATINDGRNDGARYSPKFAEWLVGLPPGFVTNAGLTRREAFTCIGNGVVPQQAELALTILLDGLNLFADVEETN